MKDIKFPLPQNTSCWLIYETNSPLTKIGFKNTFIKKISSPLCQQGNTDIIFLLITNLLPRKTVQTKWPVCKKQKEWAEYVFKTAHSLCTVLRIFNKWLKKNVFTAVLQPSKFDTSRCVFGWRWQPWAKYYLNFGIKSCCWSIARLPKAKKAYMSRIRFIQGVYWWQISFIVFVSKGRSAKVVVNSFLSVQQCWFTVTFRQGWQFLHGKYTQN